MYSRCKEIVQLMANNDQKENNLFIMQDCYGQCNSNSKVSTSSTCSDEKYCLMLE